MYVPRGLAIFLKRDSRVRRYRCALAWRGRFLAVIDDNRYPHHNPWWNRSRGREDQKPRDFPEICRFATCTTP